MTGKMSGPARMAAMRAAASVEVSSRSPHIDDLAAGFARGTEVTITALPGDDAARSVAVAAGLRAAGFIPVPHISARSIASRAALADFLARLQGEAGVTHALVIAGDMARPKGPYDSAQAALDSGLFEPAGITHVSIAGHPEGHPHCEPPQALRALAQKQAWGLRARVTVDIVTQFCFEAQPILDWLAALQRHGVTLPARIGLAGPASPATLLKFALRCGVGNSMRALRSQIGRFGRLLADAGPDDVARGLASAPQAATAQISGFHIFPFGGLRKAGVWVAQARQAMAHAGE